MIPFGSDFKQPRPAPNGRAPPGVPLGWPRTALKPGFGRRAVPRGAREIGCFLVSSGVHMRPKPRPCGHGVDWGQPKLEHLLVKIARNSLHHPFLCQTQSDSGSPFWCFLSNTSQPPALVAPNEFGAFGSQQACTHNAIGAARRPTTAAQLMLSWVIGVNRQFYDIARSRAQSDPGVLVVLPRDSEALYTNARPAFTSSS